jgi:hypothetical protein
VDDNLSSGTSATALGDSIGSEVSPREYASLRVHTHGSNPPSVEITPETNTSSGSEQLSSAYLPDRLHTGPFINWDVLGIPPAAPGNPTAWLEEQKLSFSQLFEHIVRGAASKPPKQPKHILPIVNCSCSCCKPTVPANHCRGHLDGFSQYGVPCSDYCGSNATCRSIGGVQLVNTQFKCTCTTTSDPLCEKCSLDRAPPGSAVHFELAHDNLSKHYNRIIQHNRRRLDDIRKWHNHGDAILRKRSYLLIKDCSPVPTSLFTTTDMVQAWDDDEPSGVTFYNFLHIPCGKEFQREIDNGNIEGHLNLRVIIAILSGKYFKRIPLNGKITIGECGAGAHKGDGPGISCIKINLPIINAGPGNLPIFGGRTQVAMFPVEGVDIGVPYALKVLTPVVFSFGGIAFGPLAVSLEVSTTGNIDSLLFTVDGGPFFTSRNGYVYTEAITGPESVVAELGCVQFVPDVVLRGETDANSPVLIFHTIPRLFLQFICSASVVVPYGSFVITQGAIQLTRIEKSRTTISDVPPITIAFMPATVITTIPPIAISSIPEMKTEVTNIPLPVTVTGSIGLADVRIVGVTSTTVPLWTSETRTPPLPDPNRLNSATEDERKEHNAIMHATHGNTEEKGGGTDSWDMQGDEDHAASMPVFYEEPFYPVILDLDSKMVETVIRDFRLNELYSTVIRFAFGVDIPINNQYDTLENDATDMVAGDAAGTLRNTTPMSNGIPRPPKPDKPKTDSPPPAVQDLKDATVNLAAQRISSLDRIVTAIRKRKLNLFTWVMLRRPDREWVIAVAARAWGKGWTVIDLETRAVAIWLRCSSDLERREWITKYMLEDSRIEKVCVEGFGSAISNLSLGWFSSARVLKTEADAHNAEMHAYNGNPVVVKVMADVLALPTLDSYSEDTKTDERFDGQTAALRITLQPSDTNPTDSSIASQSIVRGATQTPNGLVVQRTSFEPLETTMYPRRVSGVSPAFLNSPYRTQWTRFVGIAVLGQPLANTPLWNKLGGELLRDGFQMGRNDTLVPNGFKQWDVLTLGQMAAPNGFDMSQPILKLKLWHKILTWATQSAVFLPTSTDVSKFDPPIRGSTLANGGLNVNVADPMGFGEGLGGATSTYPFEGGAAGTITFHVCLDTVPLEHRANLAVFPRAFVRVLGDTGKEYAVFVGMLIKWPFLWYNVLRSVANGPPPVAFVNHSYTPHALTTYIDGFLDLHILLPRTGSGLNPTTQPAANLSAIRPPRSGSVAATAIPALADINIAFFGGAGPFSVPACEFMYTWHNDITAEDIRVFIMALYRMADVTSFLNMADERVAMCAVRYAPMVTGVSVLCDNGQTQILPDGRSLVAEVGVFPLTVLPDAGFLIPEFDIIAWNHVALGTRTVPAYPPRNPVASPMLTKFQNVYWSTLQARTFAITRHMILATTRLTGQTWDLSLAVGLNHEMRDYVNGFYWGGSLGQGFLPADNGALCATIYKQTHGISLWMDQFGCTVYDYIARPTGSFATIHNGVQGVGALTYNMFVPVFLPDIWIWSSLDKCPQQMAPYPSNYATDGTVGIMTEDLSIVKIGATRSVHTRLKNKDDRLTEFTLPDWNDAELWNLGLWIETAILQLLPINAVYRDGGAVANLPIGRIFSPTIVNPDASTLNTNRRYGTAFDGSRLMYPLVDDDGNNIFYTLTNQDSEVTSNIIVGQSKAFMNVWLLKNTIPPSILKSGMPTSSHSKQRARAAALRAKGKADPPGDMPSLALAATEALVTEVFKPVVNAVGKLAVDAGVMLQGVGGTVQQQGTAAPPVTA